MAFAEAAAEYMKRTGGNNPDVMYKAAFAMAPQLPSADAAAAPGDERAAWDGDSEASRAAFRTYDARERVSTRTSWQIWRDACAWQARAAASQPAVAWVRKHPDTGELSGDWIWNDVIEKCRKDSGVWFPLGFLTAPPAQVATRWELTDSDVFALIGHAELLRGRGETDMPAWCMDLAHRIAARIDPALESRVEALMTKHEQRILTQPELRTEVAAEDSPDAMRWRALMMNGEPSVYVERTERRMIQHSQSAAFSSPNLTGQIGVDASEMWVKRYVMFAWWAREHEKRTFTEAVDEIRAGAGK
ncbi:hypothetical protein [Burkholderia sp. RS02]|uniref:hypothetical protein n=1 Tax=unclassified Burkholderia TaxID=2613784 RepID=UPI003218BC54